MHRVGYVILCVFNHVLSCLSVIWLISPLDGKSPVAVGVEPPGRVPKATGVGHLFRHCCPWRHGVIWTLQLHPFHRSALRCYEWQSTDTEEVSCTHRYTTSSPRYCSFPLLCGWYELKCKCSVKPSFHSLFLSLDGAKMSLWLMVYKWFFIFFNIYIFERNIYIGRWLKGERQFIDK